MKTKKKPICCKIKFFFQTKSRSAKNARHFFHMQKDTIVKILSHLRSQIYTRKDTHKTQKQLFSKWELKKPISLKFFFGKQSHS